MFSTAFHSSASCWAFVKRVYVSVVHDDFSVDEHWLLGQVEVWVADEALEEPDEGLFVLVVGLGRDIVVLEVPSSVEDDLGGLHLSLFDIGLVADQNDWDVGGDSGQVLVPLGDILI